LTLITVTEGKENLTSTCT